MHSFSVALCVTRVWIMSLNEEQTISTGSAAKLEDRGVLDVLLACRGGELLKDGSTAALGQFLGLGMVVILTSLAVKVRIVEGLDVGHGSSWT